MSKYAGSNFSVLLVDAYNLAASLAESVTMEKESITQQTNPFGVTSVGNTPIGLTQGVLNTNGGFFDPTVDALHEVVGTVIGVARIVSAAIEGNTIGKHFMGFQGAYSQKYKVQDQRDGLTRANVTYLVSGDVDEGVIVQHLLAFTADWDTKTGGANATDAPVDYTTDNVQRPIPITSNTAANPSIVTCPIAHGLTTGQIVLISGVATSSPTINGQRTVTVISPTTFSVPVNVTTPGTGGSFVLASTVAGGVGYQHATAFSGFSGYVGKIMHSPDDSTYAAKVTFANITAIGKERVIVSGTIDRYLSFNGDVTGSGSVTVFGGFCRN